MYTHTVEKENSAKKHPKSVLHAQAFVYIHKHKACMLHVYVYVYIPVCIHTFCMYFEYRCICTYIQIFMNICMYT